MSGKFLCLACLAISLVLLMQSSVVRGERKEDIMEENVEKILENVKANSKEISKKGSRAMEILSELLNKKPSEIVEHFIRTLRKVALPGEFVKGIAKAMINGNILSAIAKIVGL